MSDFKTERKIREIKARHEAGERASAVADREWLLAEVDRLSDALTNFEVDIERGDRARVEWVRAARAARIRDAAEGRDTYPEEGGR